MGDIALRACGRPVPVVQSAPAAGSGNRGILTRTDASGLTKYAGLHIYDASGSEGRLQWQTYDGSAAPFAMSPATVVGTGWRVVHGVRSGGTLSLYLDGLLSATASDTSGNLDGGGLEWNLGARRDSFGSYFDGRIGWGAVWLRGLSAAEVRTHYDLSRRNYPGVLNRRTRSIFLPSSGGGGTTGQAATLGRPLRQQRFKTLVRM